MKTPVKPGWFRLGIVALAVGVLAWGLPLLKIHHFTLFNSGVSTVIGLLALGWFLFSVFCWVAAGFKENGAKGPPKGNDWDGPAY